LDLTDRARVWLVWTPNQPQAVRAWMVPWLQAHGWHAVPDEAVTYNSFFPANVVSVQLYVR
ncbi:MAG: hypothetical protein ACYCW6_14750, partial [Candidatus Xenobia bacterium]